MRKITLEDGRVAHFPDNTPAEVIGRTIVSVAPSKTETEQKARMAADQQKREQEAKEAKREKTDETRHSEKIGVGMQGIKASQERNKIGMDHVKATQGLGKTLEGNAAKLVQAVNGLQQSLDKFQDLGKQLKQLNTSVAGLAECVEESAKMIVQQMSKPKKLIKSDRGNLVGIKTED